MGSGGGGPLKGRERVINFVFRCSFWILSFINNTLYYNKICNYNVYMQSLYFIPWCLYTRHYPLQTISQYYPSPYLHSLIILIF
jgi:hypothetical protein